MSGATERAIIAILEGLADESVEAGRDAAVYGSNPDTITVVEDALRAIKLALKEARL